jgi:hypothetical protein
MFTIASGTYSALEMHSRASFAARTRAYLESRLQRRVEEPLLQSLFVEAEGYGLTTEQEYVRYALVALVAADLNAPHLKQRMHSVMAGDGTVAGRLDRLFGLVRSASGPR